MAGRQHVALYRVLMNINQCGCRPYGWLGLDGNRCIHVIPRQSICMQEGSGVPNLQTELNYLNLFKSYCNSSDLGFLSSRGWGRWVGGVPGDQL